MSGFTLFRNATIALVLCLSIGCGSSDSTAQIRLLHVLPTAGPLSLRVNGKALPGTVSEGSASDYASGSAGEVRIEVESAGGRIVASARAALLPGGRYTVDLSGSIAAPFIAVHETQDGYIRIFDDESVSQPLVVKIYSVDHKTLFDVANAYEEGGSLYFRPPAMASEGLVLAELGTAEGTIFGTVSIRANQTAIVRDTSTGGVEVEVLDDK